MFVGEKKFSYVERRNEVELETKLRKLYILSGCQDKIGIVTGITAKCYFQRDKRRDQFGSFSKNEFSWVFCLSPIDRGLFLVP